MNQEQTNITTGKQIRHLRTQLGMTQEELAGELNVTRQALSNWERDVNEPDLNMLKKMSRDGFSYVRMNMTFTSKTLVKISTEKVREAKNYLLP